MNLYTRNLCSFVEQAFDNWVDRMEVLQCNDSIVHVRWFNFDVFWGDEFEFLLDAKGQSIMHTINTFTGEIADTSEVFLSVDFIDRMRYKLNRRLYA